MTKIGALIHSVGLLFHIHGHKKDLAATIREWSEDIAAISTIYSEVEEKVKDIEDPLEKTKAIAAEIVARQDEIPQCIKDAEIEEYIISFCSHIVGLPLDQIRKIIHSELSNLK